MDIIRITVDDNHYLRCPIDTIARDGEGNAIKLEITFPEKLSSYWVYLDFKMSNGEKFKSPRLDVEGNKATYIVPPYVLIEGKLKIQVLFQNEAGAIWKSYKKPFNVRPSINAVDDIPDKEDFIAEAQKLLDEIKKGGGITVDSVLSLTSENPVQNKVVTDLLREHHNAIYTIAPRVSTLENNFPVLTFAVTKQGNVYTSSLTAQEIINALNANRTVICVYDEIRLPLVMRNDVLLVFGNCVNGYERAVTFFNTGTWDDYSLNAYTIAPSITIGDQMWGEDDRNVDFTETINRMIDDKVGDLDTNSVLTVYINQDGKATHTAKQIYDHVSAGGTAVCKLDGHFYPLTQCTENILVFTSISDDKMMTQIVIDVDGVYIEGDWSFASGEELGKVIDDLGNIDTALDSIIAIQESLIGGDGE